MNRLLKSNPTHAYYTLLPSTSSKTMDKKNDSENASINDHVVESEIEETAHIVDHKAERAICRKLDFHLLPILAIMYFANALDK